VFRVFVVFGWGAGQGLGDFWLRGVCVGVGVFFIKVWVGG